MHTIITTSSPHLSKKKPSPSKVGHWHQSMQDEFASLEYGLKSEHKLWHKGKLVIPDSCCTKRKVVIEFVHSHLDLEKVHVYASMKGYRQCWWFNSARWSIHDSEIQKLVELGRKINAEKCYDAVSLIIE